MGRSRGRVLRDGAERRRVPLERGEGSVGVAIVACTAAIVAVCALVAGLGAGACWVFEALAITGVIVGLGVAFGGLDREVPPWRSTPRHRRGAADPVVGSGLAAAVTARLDDLDPVEHRRLGLGAPWPAVIVGPTGVVVVSVVGLRPERSASRLVEVVDLVASVVATLRSDHVIDVRGLLVAAEDDVVAPQLGVARRVDPAGVAAAIARGNLLPMATVDELYARLSGALAPELRLDAV